MNRDSPAEAVISQVFLESIHPTGTPGRIRWIGQEQAPQGGDEQADVIALVPTRAQCREHGWLERAISDAVKALPPTGLIYVLAPRRWREKVRDLLGRRGFATGSPTLHLKSGAARYYVPLAAGPLRYALRTWSLSPRWRHVCRLIDVVPNISRLLVSALPDVGFVAAKPGSLPFDWLFARFACNGGGQALVATSWRGPESPTLLFGFHANAQEPSLIVKRGPESFQRRWREEGSRIEELGASARQAGMRVPGLFEDQEAACNGCLLQTPVLGRPVWRILSERPSELANVLDAVTGWLGRWHGATIEAVELTEERCEREILAPFKLLSDEIAGGEEYLRWIETAARALIGQSVPLVTVHGDLTMSNVLRDGQGRLGLVDWEEARPLGLPLTDFWYSACDAVAAIDEYRNRPEAFRACFEVGGRQHLSIHRREQQLREIVGGPREWIGLCFHACWLHHAANEHIRARPGADRPFLSIARVLSQREFRRTL